ncbi:DEAD/DEAH box helicase [Marinicella sp. S1101]|uniref:DEAD/DEAH box helicase n=1 Tax=Marinicella marina TaxID=2996016 RepID=UPI002260A889|nr:DEAD/DEAH box helicase [Marinicella marina]MCX7553918.1 DEAD/DEAH box helicase [Marinicella marina]MDJ1140410.1 DEAD/DEAH box helicase [Marinicella marina]
MSQSTPVNTFEELGLSSPILKAVKENGYEQPSPIQSASIPPILSGKDVLGQAQTGTGKTAAFALPILSKIDLKAKQVQVLVLTPTRELAIQVAEAFQAYARHIDDFHVLPIYGGQSYTIQLKQLKRGVQVVVGTPGRVMDHMRRKTLKLDGLQTLVLDEADEMLRMGFIDDVDWILSHTPDERQIALFSATMPKEVKKVAVNHLNNPVDIKIKTQTTTAKNINQRFWMVSGIKKLEALTRVLEIEEFDGVLIFVRTKMATEELAEKLQARGFSAEALNGDMIQKQRERLVSKLKKGVIDILIGTDVVARGLDVERISHVINYDIPYDTESYVHRIGRTGRAGRSGEAILFITKREQRMLRMIEKATNQPIKPMNIPSVADINDNRMQRFKNQIIETLAAKDLSLYNNLVAELQQETDFESNQIAAALAYMNHGDKGLFITETKGEKHARAQGSDQLRDEKRPIRKSGSEIIDTKPVPLITHPDVEMERYVLNAGRNQRVKPTHVVGMICNEAELDREYVGQIEIYDDVTTVDLPADMPKEVMDILWQARLCGRKSEIKRAQQTAKKSSPSSRKPASPKRRRKPVNKGKKKAKSNSFGKKNKARGKKY